MPSAPGGTSNGDKEVLLDVRNLTVRYDVGKAMLGRPRGRIHAVENASFQIRAGETLALVGESGCGKSTIGKALLGLTRALRGEVLFEGKRISGLGRASMKPVRKNLQMIFQDAFASLNPRMRVGDAIGEPMIIHRIERGDALSMRVHALMDRVGLESAHLRRYPHQLSGGQRQRVCIARAIALNPRLVIADEAVSALDVTIKSRIINLLLDLQREMGLAYLFISHDMAVVERISHRVAVMYLGRIVEIGSRQQVFERPAHEYTRKLLDAVPVPDPKARRSLTHLETEELPSPVRPPGYEPQPARYEEVSPGHLVAVNDSG
ncbi:MAG TPA: ATP-binding cassette domain-containing protein [Gammaproteobacteria bacterium]|nr:ATP-binding cassette domain-containing protein [Gammaproteobacteria bacterium]